MPEQVWQSSRYMAQLWDAANPAYPDLKRLSVCRVRVDVRGRLQDGLTWDELQAVKSELGYGEWYGVEVYPPDSQVVNLANFRHLWLLPAPLRIGWFK
jgi:hypothetical protein